MTEEIQKQLIESSGFWTAIGIAIGTVTNLLVWFLQAKYQSRSALRTTRFEKLSELALFFDLVDQRVRGAHSATITEGVVYWLKEKDHWKDVSFLQSRIAVQMYFPKSLREFDTFQGSMMSFMGYLGHVISKQAYQAETFKKIEKEIEVNRNRFLEKTGDIYIQNKFFSTKRKTVIEKSRY